MASLYPAVFVNTRVAISLFFRFIIYTIGKHSRVWGGNPRLFGHVARPTVTEIPVFIVDELKVW